MYNMAGLSEVSLGCSICPVGAMPHRRTGTKLIFLDGMVVLQ